MGHNLQNSQYGSSNELKLANYLFIRSVYVEIVFSFTEAHLSLGVNLDDTAT